MGGTKDWKKASESLPGDRAGWVEIPGPFSMYLKAEEDGEFRLWGKFTDPKNRAGMDRQLKSMIGRLVGEMEFLRLKNRTRPPGSDCTRDKTASGQLSLFIESGEEELRRALKNVPELKPALTEAGQKRYSKKRGRKSEKGARAG